MSVRLPNPLSAVVLLAFVLPGQWLDGSLDRAFAAAAFLLAVGVLFVKPSPWEARKPAREAAWFCAMLQLLYVLSFAYSAAFNGVQTGLQDWLELPRWLFLGAFCVHLIRHYDDQVREAMEAGMLAAVCAGPFLFANADYGYAAVLSSCWFLFFSRSRLRLVYSGAALLLVFLEGSRPSWAAALLLASAALAERFYENLLRGRARFPAQLALLSVVLFLAVPVAVVRSLSSRAADETHAGASGAEALRAIRRSPVLGLGPARYEPASSVDNQYLAWLLRGGALGVAVILVAAGIVALRLLQPADGDVARQLGAAAFIGCVLLMLLSGRFLDSFHLFFATAFTATAMARTGRTA